MNWLKKAKLIQRLFPNINSAKLKLRDQITLFESVGDFLRNGFTLSEALDFYARMHPTLQTQLNHLKSCLARGDDFADGIKNLVDTRTYYQLKISEFHGDIIKALNNLGRFLKIKQAQKNKLISLMVYPIFLLILLFGIIIGIKILIMPQIHSFSSQSSRSYGIWMLLAIVPLVVSVYGLYRYVTERSPVWRINVLLQIPLIGKVYRDYYAYYFASNLSLMMTCGMDLKKIVVFMKRFKDDTLIVNLSHDIQKVTGRGREMSYIPRKYHFIPKEMVVMINGGDTTDVLAQKLKAYSKLKFKLMIKRSSRLIALIQPVMFLIIGLVITGAYLSMLLPMYGSIKGVY